MKYSHRLADTVHLMAFVAIFESSTTSSTVIADSIQSNPSLVRRLMAQLAKAGLLTTRPGVSGARLARPAATISLNDIYHAIEPEPALLHVDEDTNMDCPVGRRIQVPLTEAFARVQQAAEAEMAQITLAQIIQTLQNQD